MDPILYFRPGEVILFARLNDGDRVNLGDKYPEITPAEIRELWKTTDRLEESAPLPEKDEDLESEPEGDPNLLPTPDGQFVLRTVRLAGWTADLPQPPGEKREDPETQFPQEVLDLISRPVQAVGLLNGRIQARVRPEHAGSEEAAPPPQVVTDPASSPGLPLGAYTLVATTLNWLGGPEV